MRAAGRTIPWHWWAILVLVTGMAFLPALLNRMTVDEGHFSTMAAGPQLWGMPFYHVGYENKPPGVYLLYAPVYRLFGFGIWKVRLLWAGLVLATAALLLIWLAQSGRPRAGLVAALTYPLLCGLVVTPNAYTEVPMALAALGAMHQAWLGLRRPGRAGHWWAAGALGAVAVLFKHIALFDMAALGLVALFSTRLLPWPARWRRLGRVVAGGALAGGAALLSLYLTGQLREFWYCLSVMTFAPDVSSTGAEALQQLRRWIPLGIITAPLWIGAAVGWLRVWQPTDRGLGRLLGLWLPLAVAGAASSRMFGFHYAVQFLPPLFLAGVPGLVWLAAGLWRRSRRLTAAAGVALLLLVGAAAWSQQERYQSVFARITGQEPDLQAELSRVLAADTRPEEPLYVVGWGTQIYAHALRRPASRWLWSFYVTLPGVPEQILADLERERPPYVVFHDLRRAADRDFAEQVRPFLHTKGYREVPLPGFPGFELYTWRDTRSE